MNEELAELNLQDDIEKTLSCKDASRWNIVKAGPLEIFITVYPKDNPDEIFQARLLWQSYPDQPPSLKFRDIESGRIDMPSAWPVVRGFRPTSLDACVNWTLEGLNLHPEWRTDSNFRWDPRGNIFLKIVRTLQDELDSHFQRRFKQ